MKTTIIVLASIFLFAFSCEGDKKENKQLNSLETEAVESFEAAGLKAEDFKEKIDELLTLELAAQVSNLPATEAEKEYTKLSSYEKLSYEWQSNRTKKVSINGQSLNVPANSTIELSWVKNTTLAQFKHDYHNPTSEEVKNAKAAMDKKANGLAAEGNISKEQMDKANNDAKGSFSNFKVEEVPNLGDYAVFVNSGIMGTTSRDLKVFYKGLSFTLGINLSDDSSFNDQKAIQTAKMIIEQKLK